MAVTNIELSSDIIAEGVANGTVVGVLTATNDDIEETHVFTLVDDSDGRFGIEGSDLIVRDTTLIDYETATSHDITVRATDTQLNTLDVVFTIMVTDSTLAAIIKSITPKATKEGSNPEIIITGQHFTEGGEPVVRIDGEPVTINSYTDTEISFVLTEDLPAKVYTVTVFNGIGL